MIIPKTVKIGGITYNVTFDERPDEGNLSVDGQIIYDKAKISLRKSEHTNSEYTKMVFLHECIHGIFYHCCIENDEQTVDRISKALYGLIVDNPEIFK